MSHAIDLYHYHVWANDKVLQHLGELAEALVWKEIQSVFPTIGDVLAHIYIVDHVWLSAMQGDTNSISSLLPAWRERVKNASPAEFAACFANVSAEYEAFLKGRDLDEIVAYPHPVHGTLRTSYQEIIQHVVNHGTYHRGNITAMLRQLGHAGVATDYVFYLYQIEG